MAQPDLPVPFRLRLNAAGAAHRMRCAKTSRTSTFASSFR